MAKSKCECNWGMGFLAMILFAAGFYFIVWGFLTQTTSGITWDWIAMLYYLIGFAVIGLGKGAKRSGCSNCKIHMK